MTGTEFVKQSLALHLFFLRIMKEHSFFLQIGFTPRDHNLANQADRFRRVFDALLADAIALSNGVVGDDVLRSGEVVTPFTAKAESVSSYFTGVHIPTEITQAETGLAGDGTAVGRSLEQRVQTLNNDAISSVADLIQFKSAVLSSVLSCKMFTVNYPLLIDHILREARLYLSMLQRLQNREDVSLEKEAYEQEAFWNRIMAEHSKFIRGLLDPTENDLIETANHFGREFDRLTAEAIQAMDRAIPLQNVTSDSLRATERIRDFNQTGTQGLLECKVRSIIIPLLGDHVLRESNHFLRLLKTYESIR